MGVRWQESQPRTLGGTNIDGGSRAISFAQNRQDLSKTSEAELLVKGVQDAGFNFPDVVSFICHAAGLKIATWQALLNNARLRSHWTKKIASYAENSAVLHSPRRYSVGCATEADSLRVVAWVLDRDIGLWRLFLAQ